jgi:RNA polymerase sigma-70 factor (ECF subfamily)
MNPTPSSETLIRRVVSGDEDALLALYQKHSRAVYSLVIYIVKEPATAEELLQDVFTTLWQKAHSFDPKRGRVETWLLQIARNHAIDWLRQQRRRVRETVSLEDDAQHESVADSQSSPVEQFNDLSGLLKALPLAQRQVIELAYFQGFTHTEIAAKLNLPMGTVKSRILLGLQKLRSLSNHP